MKKRSLTVFWALILVLSLLTGCGAASKDAVAYDAGAPMMESANGSFTADNASSALPESRKWIITMDISGETEDLDALLELLYQQIDALSGYVEGQNIHNGSAYAQNRYRSASLTVRIPVERLDAFIEEFSGAANVVRSNKHVEDVTLNYTDTESHITALKAEQDRLLELLELAETLDDVLKIESRLTNVRYELESYESRLRLYDNQIDYATVYLHIEEVREYTPVAEQTVWQRIRDGFSHSLKSLWKGAVNLTVWVLANSPYLAVAALAAWGAVRLSRFRRKKNAGKKKGRSVFMEVQADEETGEE